MDPLAHESADDDQPAPAVPDPLRIQVAAVAAQQIALDEEEIRLVAERTALEHQQRHFAAHVEEKRRELLSLSERVRADRQVDEDAERGIARNESFEARERLLEDQEGALNQRILSFNTEAELSRFHRKEAWAKLRLAQFRWRHRRGLERAALRVRSEQVEAAAQRIADARAQLERDQRAWQSQRQTLELELDGVNTRIQNQRGTMNGQEARIGELEAEIQRWQQQLAALAPDEAASAAPAIEVSLAPSDSARDLPAALPPVTSAPPANDVTRVVDLDCVAEDLADQRRQLAEAWERVVALHEQWHAERIQAAVELEALGQQLLDRDRDVQAREQAHRQAEAELRQRHQEQTQAQQQLVAWGTQLRLEENAWTAEKSRLLSGLESKDAAADQRQAALVALRQRWAKRRRRELDHVECQRIALGAFRKEITKTRLELARSVTAVDEEKRKLAEEALALEQYRVETLAAAGDPQAARRLESLRQRWLTQHADAIRRTTRERNALAAELRDLDERYDALDRRAAEVAAAELESMEKQTASEQQQLETQARHLRQEHDLQHAQTQRLAAEQQIAALRDEVERIARALLDQSDPPSLPLERAA